MGLLDFMNDPQMAGAMGLLSASGPSRMPVSLGQALASGYQSQQSAIDALQQRQMGQMRMDALKEQIASQKVAKERRDAFRATLPAQYQNLPDELLDEYLKASMQPKKPIVLGKTLVDPESYKTLATDATWADEQQANRDAKSEELKQRHLDRLSQIQAAAAGRQPAQPMAPVAYVDDKGQTVWGTITEAKGRPAANFSPALQGQIAGAKAEAKTTAEETVKASLDAPRIIDNANTALKNADDLLKHPGFKQAVGASSMIGIQRIPGTDAKDFMNRLDQLKGGAFLEAFNTLKGGGQITEVEGKKATDAIARMDNATSEGEFIAAVNDYKDVIKRGMNRAKMKAKPVAQPVVDTSVDALLKKYGG